MPLAPFLSACRNEGYPNKGIDTIPAIRFAKDSYGRKGEYPNKGIDTIQSDRHVCTALARRNRSYPNKGIVALKQLKTNCFKMVSFELFFVCIFLLCSGVDYRK